MTRTDDPTTPMNTTQTNDLPTVDGPTGLIVAMDEELAIILEHLQQVRQQQIAELNFYEGEFFGHPVVAVVCGVGKVHAALCTQILISTFKVAQVINIGIAGGLHPDLVPGDIVIADSLVQHDMDVRALGLPLGQIYRSPYFDFKTDTQLRERAIAAAAQIDDHQVKVGRIATGDQFIANNQTAQAIYEEFGALACEMESGSIAQVCTLNQRPFVCIRSLSDNANSGANMDFASFLPIAVKNSSVLLKAMFRPLNAL